ncbi:MAG: terminase small subunit [Candidatus Glassbacteria bacterium]
MSTQDHATNKCGLSSFEEEFCHEYLKQKRNGTVAALDLRSHLARNSAATLANRLLKKPEIRARINELTTKLLKKIDLDSERWMQELARLCVFDIRRAVEWTDAGVTFKSSADIDDQTAAAIKSVRRTVRRYPTKLGEAVEERMELSFASKEKALELYGRVLGKFIDKARKEERPDLGKQLELAQQRLDAHRKKQGLEIVRNGAQDQM